MVSPGDRHVVGVHHAVDESDEHPLRHQRCLGGDDRLEQREVGMFGLRGAGVVPGDRVVGETSQQVRGRRRIAAYWKLPTRRWLLATRASTAPGSGGLPLHLTAGRHHRQRAGGGDAQRVHRFADDVLAQHRTDRGEAVAAARERCAPRALQVQVAEASFGVDELTDQQRAAVAQARNEAAELMAGVGLRDRGWRRAARRLPTRKRSPSGLRSHCASRPNSVASGSLSTSSRGLRRRSPPAS